MADEKELKDQRVPIMMTPSELEAIDDWMFKNRIRSRGEAIRRLCQIAMNFERSSARLLESAMKGSQAVLSAQKNARSAFEDPSAPRLELQAASFEAILAGMTAVIDLTVQIGTLWTTSTTLKIPDKLSEVIELAMEIRTELENPEKDNNQKMKDVTTFLKAYGVLVEEASADQRTINQ